jgi:putative ABC transport system permease protein
MGSRLRAAWWRLRTLVTGRRLDRELREELQFHRDMLERDFLHAGMPEAEAGAAARKRLGNITALAEESRLHWGLPALQSAARDARYALRSLRAHPTFTLAATLTLALGVGATVTVFSLVDAVLLRPLPYRDGAELVSLYLSPPEQEGRVPLSYPDFRDVAARSQTLSAAVFARGEDLRVRGEYGAEGMAVAFVSGGLFPLLGTPPALGRGLGADDERAGAERTIVLGYQVWMERFGGDSGILNRPIATTDGPYTVIGVMPAAFAWPEWAQAWSPLAAAPFAPGSLERRAFRTDARIIARVAPGAAYSQVTAELDAIGRELAGLYPAENAELTVRAAPLRAELVGPVRQPLFIFLGAVTGLLLIACANVANLSLARASARARELGVRVAIGASRARLAGQLLVESAVLAAIGGLLGTALAYGAVKVLVGLAPSDLPRLAEVNVDGRVLGFALALAMLTALVFGVAPAVTATAGDPVRAVKAGGRTVGGSRRASRLRAGFVVAEIAIACALVVGSGLLVKSFANLRGADRGFDSERLISLRIEPLESRYPTPDQRLALFEVIREAVARIPGVERVTYINHSPATRSGVFSRLESDGDPRPGGRAPGAAYRLVAADYFVTIGQRVIEGRGFTPGDMMPDSRAVVVNETLARLLWGTASPLGRRIVVDKQVSGDDTDARVDGRVVGVVEDIKDYDRPATSLPEVYLPFPVNPWQRVYLAVRTRADPEPVIPAIQQIVRSQDRDLPVRRAAAVEDLLNERLARRRFNALLVTGFGVLAMLIASCGIYGVVAYAVAQRTNEIGIRAALGASPGDLVRRFVGRGMAMTALGVGLGLVLAGLFAYAMRAMLFGVAALDASTFTVTAATVAVVALAASYFPARRALRVDPVIAMRAD